MSAERSGPFRDVALALGARAGDLEDTAILNNAEADQDVRAGERLKLVRPGRR